MIRKMWKKWEIDFLKNNIETLSCKDIADYLGRTEISVNHVCHRNNILKRKPRLKIGDKIERLLIKDIYYKEIYGQRMSMAKCICDCGTEKDIRLHAIRNGNSKSCGCLAVDKARELGYTKNKTHGLTNHKLYNTWRGIKDRCTWKGHVHYHLYGGKGITICDEWSNDFKNFYDWALANGWREGLTVDRKNNNLGYYPENCKISTRKQQCNNRSTNRVLTAFGETKNAKEWFEDERCILEKFHTFISRLNYGWLPEEALTKPLMNKKGA
jgi:hypothetical protein